MEHGAVIDRETTPEAGPDAAAGGFSPEQQEMMRAVMRFADRKVRTILSPRSSVDWLDVEHSTETIAGLIDRSARSHIPVCRGGSDDVLGVVRATDVADRLKAGQPLDLPALVRQAPVVPETAGALGVLEQIKRARSGLAVVVDERGGVQGVVTASDILGEMAGGLAAGGTTWEPQARRREDGSWLVDGDMEAARAGEMIGYPELLEPRRFATLAGFVLDRFRQLPTSGDSFVRQGFRFEVVDMDGRRIDKVLVVPPQREPESD